MPADWRGRTRRTHTMLPQMWRSGAPRTPAALGAIWTLGVDPRLLILPEARLVVSWSPKCACTHVVAWALDRRGLLDAALAHGDWIHRYRVEVLNPSEEAWRAGAAVSTARGAGHTLLRITRDPAARLVSVFRHVVRNPAIWPKLAGAVTHPIDREGLSLEDLDRALSAQDLHPLSAADPHPRPQSHPVWRLGFYRVVTVNIDTDSLDAGLDAFDAEFGLRGSDAPPERLGEVAAAGRYAAQEPYRGRGPVERHRFHRRDTDGFPKAELLASPLLHDMVRRHHAAELGRVTTGDTAGRLFARPVG